MPNTVKIKRSGTAAAAPTSLEHGELALNYADGKVFWKNASNAISSFTFQDYVTSSSVSSFAASLIDDADAAAARETLGALPVSSPQAEFQFACLRYGAGAPIVGRRANGTKESPEAANNVLATFTGQGWDGVGSYRTGAAMYVTAQETFSDTACGSHIRFYTVPAGTTTLTERMKIDHDGEVGIGTSSPTARLDVNADTIRLRTARTPASASATGNAGDICWNSTHLFICVATNTWRRVAHSSW